MGRYGYGKPKAQKYQNTKIKCPCGGYYTSATYSGSYANIDPKTKHEESKMHQEFVANGNKMSAKVKEKLEKKAAAELAEKRAGQVLCGCGSWYNVKDNGPAKAKHLGTAKHAKWAGKVGSSSSSSS